MVRVRFAPSPTGFLHIGGARTALFNWLFARHNQGKFILRIEDTDQARSKQIYLDQILEDLNWLGLHWDEGPYFQSKRIGIYQELAQQLVQKRMAYTEGQAVILKIPNQHFAFQDLIRGTIKFAAEILKDQVLIKSDGTPTYNFACVIDDCQMEITHVIRGEDHISNTPKQIAIAGALELNLPKYAHIPLIVDTQRSRLSKRTGAMPISHYRKQGYLPAALFNFLALLGWSIGAEQELALAEEIIKKFSLERVLPSAAAFNIEKLDWINGQYIRDLDTQKLTELVVPLLLEKKYIQDDYDQQRLLEIITLLKPRAKTLCDFIELSAFFFQKKIDYTAEAKDFLRKDKDTKDIFNKLIKALEKIEPFDTQTIEQASRSLISAENIRSGALIHPVRVALTGKRTGPGLFELMAVLGREEVLTRLQRAIGLLTSQQ